jgi:hypothetical protein
MSYQAQAEAVNLAWSRALARALAKAQDVEEEKSDQFLRGETLAIPVMLYYAMLEIVRLTELLLPAMRDGKIEFSQGILTKINTIHTAFKALPSVPLGSEPAAFELLDAVVARANGRWPL